MPPPNKDPVDPGDTLLIGVDEARLWGELEDVAQEVTELEREGEGVLDLLPRGDQLGVPPVTLTRGEEEGHKDSVGD